MDNRRIVLDTTWAGLYMQRGGFHNPIESALIVSEAWKAAASWGDQTVAQNLLMNMVDPVGVMNTLDWAGVPVSETLSTIRPGCGG